MTNSEEKHTATEIDQLQSRIELLEYMLTILLYHIVNRDFPKESVTAKGFLQSLDLPIAAGDEGRRFRFKLFEQAKDIFAKADRG